MRFLSGLPLVGLVALAAACGDEPCGVGPGQTAADCVAPEPTRLSIQFQGSGSGFVQVMPGPLYAPPVSGTDLICTESCVLEVPKNDLGWIWLRTGTTQTFTPWSLGSPCIGGTYRECQLTSEDQEVSVTFDKDQNEVATLFLDDTARALAFVGGGDLVAGTLTSLRRIGLDGTQRWSVPRARITLMATSATDLIVIGPDVAAYRGDGSLAWDVPHEAAAVATLPDGSPIIVTPAGRVIALSAIDGSIRWQSGDVGATTLAVDAAGTVAAGAGDRVLRFDANGAPLPTWQAPGAIVHLLFESTNQLATTNLMPNPPSGQPELHLDYHRYDPSGIPTRVFTRDTLAPNGFVAAGPRLFHWGRVPSLFIQTRPPALHLVALDLAGEMTWEVTKGYSYGHKGVYGADLITPHAAACRGQTCAVAGSFDVPPATGMTNWIGVYAIP